MRILLTGLLASAIMIGSFLLWGGDFEQRFADQDIKETLGPDGWLLVVGLLMLDVVLPVPATAALTARAALAAVAAAVAAALRLGDALGGLEHVLVSIGL